MTFTFTEKQVWNLDTTIAGFISEGLLRLADEADKSHTEQLENIREVAAIFADYSQRWNDECNAFAFEPGGSRAADVDDALIWLILNFRALWD